MPTLLDDPQPLVIDEKLIAEFDLEHLARISEPPPHLVRPQPRSGLRRTMVAAVLALLFVAGLAPLPHAGSAAANSCAVAK